MVRFGMCINPLSTKTPWLHLWMGFQDFQVFKFSFCVKIPLPHQFSSLPSTFLPKSCNISKKKSRLVIEWALIYLGFVCGWQNKTLRVVLMGVLHWGGDGLLHACCAGGSTGWNDHAGLAGLTATAATVWARRYSKNSWRSSDGMKCG